MTDPTPIATALADLSAALEPLPPASAAPPSPGVDHLPIARIGRHVPADRLLDRLASPDERATLFGATHPSNPPPAAVARLMAAKEACAKALTTGIAGELSWHDLHLTALSRRATPVACPRYPDHDLHVASTLVDGYALAVAICL